MYIKTVKIWNFKKFSYQEMTFQPDINILVGDNDAGKSTIIEAIELALSGVYNHRYIRNELSQSLFNKECVDSYLKSLTTSSKQEPPKIAIELHFGGDGLARFCGDNNKNFEDSCGVSLKIEFDEKNSDLYEEWILSEEFDSLPIEFYGVKLESFDRNEEVTHRHIPIKSAMIDASSAKGSNGGDLYISKIIKDMLEPNEVVDVSQAFRKSKDFFARDESICAINSKVGCAAKISDREVSITVDQPSKNAWESGLFTYLDGIPFTNIGKGEQSLIKTKIALAHKKAKEKNIILIEEPENHLSHSKLNTLLNCLTTSRDGRQIIVTTHSSFVANKLGLNSLIILSKASNIRLSDLTEPTQEFFSKISGYDTLRLTLCEKAILVEGDSDELIVQRAYMDANEGKLPIDDGIDVISVGTSFLRFLEIAKLAKTKVCVVTDNDGFPEKVIEKYKDFVSDRIKICFDADVDKGADVSFNYNTLEPKLLKVNSVTAFAKIFGTKLKDENSAHTYMKNNKTDCALKIFEHSDPIRYPQYILDAVSK